MKIKLIYIISLILLLFTSCMGTRHLRDNQLLLNKNEVQIKAPIKLTTKNISKSELEALAKPTENKEILGFLHHAVPLNFYIRPRLVIFDWFAGGRTTNFKWWVQNKIGEPYSLYDSIMVKHSAMRMRGYLFNKGYYDAQVQYKIERRSFKRVNVTYTVIPKTLYVVNEIQWKAENDSIQQILNEYSSLSNLKIGLPYDDVQIKEERERIEILLRNKGYYDFSQEYVYFVADTAYTYNKKSVQFLNLFAENKQPIRLYVHVKNPDNGYHMQYTVNQVYVFPNYSKKDSVQLYSLRDSQHIQHYIFVYRKSAVLPRALTDKLFIEPNKLYSLENHQKTINRLAGLRIYSSVKFQFQKTGPNQLDGFIYLTPKDRQGYTYELEASTTSDFVGGGGNIGYEIKNLFHRADLLSIVLKGALESPFENANNQLRTLDAGLQATEVFPQFILPIRIKNISKNQAPKTKISVSYNYLKRLNYYTQYQTNFAFGYDWNESAQKHHSLNPLTLNFTQYYQPSEDFIQLLNNNPLLKSSFQNKFIPGLTYSYNYTSLKDAIAYKNYFYLKANIDLAGNTLHGINLLKNKLAKTADQAFRIFQIDYSQYAKLDLENKYTLYFSRKHYLVSRLEVGAGVPYGYSKVLPYAKQFYSGGPNGLRGWRVRTLGPGSYSDSSANPLTLNQTGDAKLEGNLEYRFNMWSYFKGALFVDAGNIWLLKQDTLRPGAAFEFNRFYKQIAVATGFGIRFDYDYFVIRMDIGIPIVNPVLPYGKQYLGNQIKVLDKAWRKTNLKYNLAIAYPF